MKSGRHVLSQIDATLRSARSQLRALDAELETLTQALADTTRKRAQTLRRLALIRLDAIESGRYAESLDAADALARQHLAEREQAVAELEREIKDAEALLAELEQERESMHAVVDDHAKALAEVESEAQASLEQDPGYRAAFAAAREAEAIADAATAKVETAERDRLEKGRPYESDPLFSYLWQKHYGTSEYEASAPIRALDDWVAGLCGYGEARPTYWMLLEIPKRLSEHAAALRGEADDRLANLVALENDALASGAVPDAQARLADAEARQDEVDERLAGAEHALQTLLGRRGHFASGNDAHLSKAIATLKDAMRHSENHELIEAAAVTPGSEDDALTRELIDLREREQELRSELSDLRRVHGKHLDRINELTGVRGDFKEARYDDVRSGFANGALIGTLLGELIAGAVEGGQVWDTIKREQRYRDVGNAWPDFGSGGLQRKRKRRGSWHWPGGRRGRGGFRLPRSGGGKSRGGFRTGGGF